MIDKTRARNLGLLAGGLLLAGVLCVLVISGARAATTVAGAGEGAGQVDRAVSVAVDQGTGTAFVADSNNHRIDVFDSAGLFQRAFGFGVSTRAPELQVCTTVCVQGLDGAGSGEIRPTSVAIGPTNGDIYAADFHRGRVEVYSPAGQFLFMFGKGVDQTPASPHPDICPAGDSCGAGSIAVAPGSISLAEAPLAIDTAGNVWVGDSGRIEEFNSSGEFLSEVAIPGAGEIRSLAIDGTGNFFVLASGLSGVRRFDPSGTPLEFAGLGSNALDASGSPTALTLDGSGGIIVGDRTSPYRFLVFDATIGVQTKVFGLGEVTTFGGEGPEGQSLATGGGSLLATNNRSAGGNAAVQSFAIPGPGPLVVSGSEAAVGVQPTTATLKATLNPENHATIYRFEYIDEAEYESDGGQFGPGTQQTPTGSVPASFEYEEVEATLGAAALLPSTTYRYRVSAEDSEGHTVHGDTESFETKPPVEIIGPSAIAVNGTGATLEAELNPLGVEARYRVLYGTTSAYGSETPLAPLGAGSVPVSVTPQLHGLQPQTTYHYRFLATDERGGVTYTTEGPDLTFTTQAGGGSLVLPDGRAWEQVSPLDKHGATIRPLGALGGEVQAASDGDAFTFVTSSPTESEPRGVGNSSQIFSRRAPGGGWTSRALTAPHGGAVATFGTEYQLFSEDLGLGIREPFPGSSFTSLSPESSPEDTENTPYLRHDFSCEGSPGTCFMPLLTSAEGAANVPAGTEFGNRIQFLGATPDLAHIVIASEVSLTELQGSREEERFLYELSLDTSEPTAPTPISVLPSGELTGGHGLGGGGPRGANSTINAISSDGTRVFWTKGEDATEGDRGLYLRDTARDETLKIDVPEAGAGAGYGEPKYLFAGRSGSGVVFADRQELTDGASASQSGGPWDLYHCSVVESAGHLACELEDLAPPASGRPAEVMGALATTPEADEVFFVANGVLAETPNSSGERATAGDCGNLKPVTATCNVYFWREDPITHHSKVTFVGRITQSEARPIGEWMGGGGVAGSTARVSPGGRYLAFTSSVPLTAYDNRDTHSGKPDREVFLYDTKTEGLICASCNPTGARPSGVGAVANTLVEPKGNEVPSLPPGSWTAAGLPERPVAEGADARYQPRFLSDSGRLFFNSSDALVPQDTNGTQDVYEYEPAGIGTCTASQPTYSYSSSGCVDLISSGTSPEESAFMDASEGGGDAFFLTSSRLASTDRDNAYDVYDAHACTAESHCPTSAEPPKPTCTGDACQPPAEAPGQPTLSTSALGASGNFQAGTPAKKKHRHRKRKAHHKASLHHHRHHTPGRAAGNRKGGAR